MTKKKTTYQARVAVFFLISILMVYGAYFFCNYSPLVSILEVHVHESDHHHSDTDHKHSHSHEDEGATSDSCCSDFTNTFLNEAKLLVKQLHLEHSSDYSYLISYFLIIEKPVLKYSGTIVRYVYPPPNTKDIRIFIQSFII